MLEPFVERRFLEWPKPPIPGLSLPASGLIALADLSTIAKRTALTGTSSWVDVLLLAPGLHYQQKAESLGPPGVGGEQPEITNLNTGSVSRVTNSATVQYLRRVGDKNKPVVLDVGESRGAASRSVGLGARGRVFKYEGRFFRLSTILYFGGPVMTIVSIILMILSKDWWGFSLICVLMVSRALNVWIIRQRTKDQPPPPQTENVHENWWVILGDHRNICLRGLAHDLAAITTGEWMRPKTTIEDYLEAIAKVLVYMVGVFSANLFQTGNFILITLLLVSAGLLALSNAHMSTFNMNGRVAEVTGDTLTEAQTQRISKAATRSSSYITGGRGAIEKSEITTVIDSTYLFSDEVTSV